MPICVGVAKFKSVGPRDGASGVSHTPPRTQSPDINEDVRRLERETIVKPTPNSFVECAVCQDACSIGRALEL